MVQALKINKVTACLGPELDLYPKYASFDPLVFGFKLERFILAFNEIALTTLSVWSRKESKGDLMYS